MSESSLDVIREQYAATNRRDFSHVMDLYTDDVVLRVPRLEGLQNPGTYEGKEAVGEWFGDWFRSFAHDYRFEIDEIRELSGAEVHSRNAYLYRVRGGKIAEVGFFGSPDEAIDAASLPEWSGGQTD